MNNKLKSYGGNGFQAKIYNEFFDKERFFVEWSEVVNSSPKSEGRTLGPYETFQAALDVVISISAALKPINLEVDIKE